MRILHSLSYYRPHYSGLTVYTERLVRNLAARGHQVTVLTSRYDKALPPQEYVDGVMVRRVGVAMRVSKGPVMPTYPCWAARLIASHDVLHLHVPQLDAAPLALLARALGKPVVLTYHCDLRLPRSLINRLANTVSGVANTISAGAADVVVTNTRDYAESSTFLRRYLTKLEVIPPPIEIGAVNQEVVARMRTRLNLLEGQPVIGMAARLATEKGAEVLAKALPRVLAAHPEARVLYAGQHQGVMGEEIYAQRLRPLLQELGEHWTFLGILEPDELAAFFALCNLVVLPSLNSTESFGMVQAEAMLCGTPAIASDLPGMRRPVQETGMGLIFEPGNEHALSTAILRLLEKPDAFQRDPQLVEATYGSQVVTSQYEALYERLVPMDRQRLTP